MAKKQNLPLNIDEVEKEIKDLVCIGAMRQYITNFYKFGANVIINQYGIDKGENGHRYVCSTLFNEFASNNASLFKNLTYAKHRYLGFTELCYYATYLQGLFNHLAEYKRIHKDVSSASFERIVKNFAYNFRQKAGKIIVRPDDANAKPSVDKTAKELYEWFDRANSEKVQNLVDQTLRESIYITPEMFDSPIILDLESMKNNGYFDKRKSTYYNYELYPDLIDKDWKEYEEYMNAHPEEWEEKPERVYNEAYDIPDEFYEMEREELEN